MVTNAGSKICIMQVGEINSCISILWSEKDVDHFDVTNAVIYLGGLLKELAWLIFTGFVWQAAWRGQN